MRQRGSEAVLRVNSERGCSIKRKKEKEREKERECATVLYVPEEKNRDDAECGERRMECVLQQR